MFVVRDLVHERANIHVFDPQVEREDMFQEFEYTCGMSRANTPGFEDLVTTAPDAYSACDGAHAFATLTEWDQFKDLDFERIYKNMAKPAFVFDGRNILDQDKLRKIGFEVYAIGKPNPSKFNDAV